jgi:hypothetical protein
MCMAKVYILILILKKMSFEEYLEYKNQEQQEQEEEEMNKEKEERLKEMQRDEDVTNFSFWMSENKLPLPIEYWHDSKRKLRSVLSIFNGGTGKVVIQKYRFDLLSQAADYYVSIYGGDVDSVLAEMILYYK